jgi:hypothetical protein
MSMGLEAAESEIMGTGPKEAAPPVTKCRLRRLHAATGIATLLLFLLSGQYMARHQPPLPSLDPALHAMFTSRHIYMLAASLVNLALGAYLMHAGDQRRRALQWLGSALVLVATVLLVTAFIVEPISGRGRTAASSFGLFGLLAGTLLHFLASLERSAPNESPVMPSKVGT